MKIRSFVLIGAAVALSAFGEDVTPTQVLGVMKVESANAYTIVAVPWLGVGGGAVQVSKLVQTTNLSENDWLHVYNASTKTYSSWKLVSNAWTPTVNASVEGMAMAAGAADATIPVGSALWIYRQDTSKPFYLYGQYTNAISQTLSTGTTSEPVWNMIANPNATAFNLNTDTHKFAGAEGDSIQVPGTNGVDRAYTYSEGAWGYQKKTVTTKTVGGKERTVTSYSRETEDCTIPPGVGCWYVSTGNTLTTITWR